MVAIDEDPVTAAAVAQAWAEVTIEELDEAISHAWRAQALAGGKYDVDCSPAENVTPAVWVCQTSPLTLDAAALDGHPIAQVELANYFLYGVPDKVQQSESHAFDWYGLAARQGVVIAQLRYGQLRFLGIGAPQNQAEGLMWVSIAQEVAGAEQEPYWSHRVYPLDAEISSGDGASMTLRDAVSAVYRVFITEVSDEVEANANEAALAWIAQRTED